MTWTAVLVRRARLPLLTAAAVLAAVGFLWLLLGPVTAWATPVAGLTGKDLADVRTATRQTLLAAVGGLAVLAGLAFTARTYYLTRRGQLTDRYTKAIAQLASDRPTERLGGIYALEHLMAESDRDHDTIVEVLAAFIRQHPAPPLGSPHEPGRMRAHPDVQAAVTVLGRRPRRPERHPPDLRASDLRNIDMTYFHMPGTDFSNADLRSANLVKTTLTSASMVGASLQGAALHNAQLQGAFLMGAQLEYSILMGANLQDAKLDLAQLNRARLGGANLTGATLDGARLQGADFVTEFTDNTVARPIRGLTVAQLAAAELDDSTLLPHDLRSAMNEYRRLWAAMDEYRRTRLELRETPDQDRGRSQGETPDAPQPPSPPSDR